MENINIAELLKDCPKGMKLYSPIFGYVYLDKIRPHLSIVVATDKEQGDSKEEFLYDGRYRMNGECMLFPSKGKTTWEGFKIPFKDGDIIADDHKNIAIYKGKMWYNRNLADYYCGYRNCDNRFFEKPKKDGHFGLIEELHLATEEEKQKLFDVIKENGYEWNEETKTLEKLIEPKFKVGYKVRHKDDKTVITITGIKDDYYFIQFYNIKRNDYQNEKVLFKDQDKYELVPNKFDITTLIPFESRVLVRDGYSEKWKSDFWGFYDSDHAMNYPYECCGNSFAQCIPYEGNEHLLSTTDDCDEFYKTWK